jgi:HD-like signal output (HDOD) protein
MGEVGSLAWDKERIIRGLESGNLLPSLSPLTVRLIALAANDNSSLSDIAALIEKDPSLTIRILKLANSVFFRYGNPTKTVRQAVVRIGVRHTRLLALSLLLKDTFPMKKVGAADYRRFWRLCLYQGLIAQSLAQRLEIGDAEEAFTAGLTLEIGLLVLLHAFVDPSEPADIPWYPLSGLLEWEKQKYGVDHREIGEFILTRWKFPASFILCQKPTAIARTIDDLLPLVRVCAMASRLSAFICEPGAYLPEVFDTLEFRFRLPKPLIHEIVATALHKVEDLSRTFEVEVHSERDTELIMKKARAVLAQLSGKLREQRSPSDTKLRSLAASQKPGDSTEAVRHKLEAVEHEIRNPLTAVGGLVRMLAKTIDPTSEQGGHIKFILSETARLEQALKDIGQMVKR